MLIKRHPQQGARVVSSLDGYGPVGEIILAHHERIDGKGYPRGLKGDEIPELVADHLRRRHLRRDDRARLLPRRRSPPSRRSQELRRVAGKQLDASFVEVFIELLDGQGRRLPPRRGRRLRRRAGAREARRTTYSEPAARAGPRAEADEAARELDREQPPVSGFDYARAAPRRPAPARDVHVDAGAQLEAGQLRQPRHDVDVPVEVLGAARARCAPTG